MPKYKNLAGKVFDFTDEQLDRAKSRGHCLNLTKVSEEPPAIVAEAISNKRKQTKATLPEVLQATQGEDTPAS